MATEKPIRIQKVIADRGLASRREAEKWIEEARVTINGKIASLGDKCRPGTDTLMVDDRIIPADKPRKIVIALNKPIGYVCTNRDPHAERTVFALLPPDIAAQKLFCVGRLDKESEGLLLMTNDGSLQHQLAHPSYNVQKLYHVLIDTPLKQSDIPKLRKGIKWEEEHLSIDKVFPMGKGSREDWKHLEVSLHHGKKREIRRLFYAFGYKVKKLKRVQIGNFRLKGIPRGHIRELGPADIKRLFQVPGSPT